MTINENDVLEPMELVPDKSVTANKKLSTFYDIGSYEFDGEKIYVVTVDGRDFEFSDVDKMQQFIYDDLNSSYIRKSICTSLAIFRWMTDNDPIEAAFVNWDAADCDSDYYFIGTLNYTQMTAFDAQFSNIVNYYPPVT